ncbi:MAG: rhomboid family intramembrane serine protease [Chitinivibrionia bacterium]|nr:rhomboid family intramembrane serine protease [Chitinivibrionia bacterium]
MFLPLKDINPTAHVPVATLSLIALNVLVFIYELAMGPELSRFVAAFGVTPYELTHGVDLVGSYADLPISHAQGPPLLPLTVFSSMFMHGSFLHIFGNMLYLWIFGNNIEDILGPVKFILFYLACGVAATFVHVLSQPSSIVPTIGASGAVAGVLGAYLLMYPRAYVLTLVFVFVFIRFVALPASFVLVLWFVVQAFSGFTSLGDGVASGGVAWFAHIGGFLAGMLLIKVLASRTMLRQVVMEPLVERLFIDSDSQSSRMAAAVIARYPEAAVVQCGEDGAQFDARSAGPVPERSLFIARNRGRFIRPFPLHPWHRRDGTGGCDYNLLLGFNCSAACSYCFTQAYFEHRCPTLFSNTDDMRDDLRSFLDRRPDARVSTGEFMDSLCLDEVTGTTERILELVRSFPLCALELRTKSCAVDHMPPAGHPNAIAAWSINPSRTILDTEERTAGFRERLEAAGKLRAKGYRIALRIDPIIMNETYLDAYAALADAIEEELPWRHVSEVFLGSVRFDKRMLGLLAAAGGRSALLNTQLILCPDGKYRPHKFARVAMYRRLVAAIARHAPGIPIRLSMEPSYVHDAVFAEHK